MGEFIEIGVNGASMQVVSGVFCAAALGLYALMQPDPSDDDDSNGGGGGGYCTCPLKTLMGGIPRGWLVRTGGGI